MQRSTDRILTTHTGSLPRTREVLELLGSMTRGESVDPLVFDAAVQAGVLDVVARQANAGIAIVNDGEMGKSSFANYHMQRLGGFTPRELPEVPEDLRPSHAIDAEARDYPEFFERWAFNATSTATRSGGTRPMGPVCTGPITYLDTHALRRDIENVLAAAAAAGAVGAFMSAVPPTGMGNGFGANEHYATEDEYHAAMADAMRVEYEAIAAAGIVLQFDCNWGVLSRISGGIDEARRTIAHSIEVLNYACRNIDPDAMRIHLCWGADEAPHHRDLPLTAIVDLMMTARPNGLGVVASNGRHEWEWRVWRDVDVPDGKVIIPGVIDSTTNIIEHPETVAERIVRFAAVLGKENIIAGVDCGLDTLAGSAQVMPRIAWAKLESLGEGARLASESLF